MDLPVCGACYDRDCLAVDVEPETVVACGDGDDLVGVDHADVDALGGDHDGAALRHAPLDDDRPGAGWWRAGCAAGTAQPGPVGGLNGAGQGAKQLAVVADDGHLSAVHPQGDALSGEFVANVDLPARQADQTGAVDQALDLDGGAGSSMERRWSGRAGTVGGQAGQLDDPEPGGQGLEPDAVQQDMQDWSHRPRW